MNWEIFVENERVDIPQGLSAQVTFSIDDIRDFATRNTAFSKTITLPGTARNKRVFGHVFDAGASNSHDAEQPNVGYNYNASKVAGCIMFVDGIQIFKGVIRIMDIIVSGSSVEFETAVFGELGGLIAKLADKKVSDLDFSDYDHDLTVDNIKDTWTTLPGSGYYYPLIDYGYSTDKVKFPIETFRPCFYLKEIMERMFADAGYTLTDQLMSFPSFRGLILPFNGQYMARTVQTAIRAEWDNIVHPSVLYDNKFPLNYTGDNYFDPDNTIPLPLYQITWNRNDSIRAKVKFSADWTRGGTVDHELQVKIVRLQTAEEIVIATNQMSDATSGTIEGETAIDINPGDRFSFYSNIVGLIAGSTVEFTNIVITIEGEPDLKIPYKVGDMIQANDLLPVNIFQLDLLKWYVKMFNLYIYEDKDKANHLHIAPYVSYYQFASQYQENWDDKLDRSKPYSMTPMGELNSRSYEFTYKADNDYYNELYKNKFNEVYGSFVHDTGIEFVKDRNKVEIGFSPSPLVQYNNSSRILTAIYKKRDNGEYERIAHNPRILFRSLTLIDCEDWYITHGETEELITEGYPYAGHLFGLDLNFGAPREVYFAFNSETIGANLSLNLFNAWWSRYIAEISHKDSKLLKGYFKLTATDIANLDFSKPKYINGVLWRLNKISDYTTNGKETTKCELLKVINL